MKQSEILTLFDYSQWANNRILDTAEKLSPKHFTSPAGLSFGSLRGTLVHTLTAEWIWRLRCQEGISPPDLLSEADFPTLEALRERWRNEEKSLRSYLESLTDDDLSQSVGYRNTKGTTYETILWQILVHVVNHGTQFRSEAAVYLTEQGHSPGDLDLLIYLRGLPVSRAQVKDDTP